MPIPGDADRHLLYITTEVEADHSKSYSYDRRGINTKIVVMTTIQLFTKRNEQEMLYLMIA